MKNIFLCNIKLDGETVFIFCTLLLFLQHSTMQIETPYKTTNAVQNLDEEAGIESVILVQDVHKIIQKCEFCK
jgi:hypothetical protein